MIDWALIVEYLVVLSACSYLAYLMGYEKAEKKFTYEEPSNKPYDWDEEGIW